MAFTTIYSNGQRANMVREFVVDVTEDKDKIPTDQLLPGSTCFVINESQWYMLNHSYKWTAINIGGGGGGDTDHVIYDGGEETDSPDPSDHIIYNGGDEDG